MTDFYQVSSPIMGTYADGIEPWDPGCPWFVEGEAYLPADSPWIRHYRDAGACRLTPVEAIPAGYTAMVARLRRRTHHQALPVFDAAEPLPDFVRREL